MNQIKTKWKNKLQMTKIIKISAILRKVSDSFPPKKALPYKIKQLFPSSQVSGIDSFL